MLCILDSCALLFTGMVSKQTSEVQETGETAAESVSTVSVTTLQRRHDEEHLPDGEQRLPAVPASQHDEQISSGRPTMEFYRLL